MKKHLFIVLLFLAFSYPAFSNWPSYYFEHYSTKDGLPQQTVMNILQDEKGFMWFTTWKGFCKFDGYEFTNYDILRDSSYYIKDTRFDRIFQDKYGYIWLQSSNGEVHRFDPKTETFKGLQQEQYPLFPFYASRLQVKPSGKVWVYSHQAECILIPDSSFTPILYGTDKDVLKGRRIYTVLEDRDLNSWLLTNNGLIFIPYRKTTPRLLHVEKNANKEPTKQAFYSFLELDDEIWFGSDNGRVWKYSKKNESFDLLETGASSRVFNLYDLPGNRVAIITPEDGLFVYDRISDKLARFNPAMKPGFFGKKILSTSKDKSGNIWFSMDCYGVFRFDMQMQKFSYFKSEMGVMNENIFTTNFFIIEDINGYLWVHPKGGGFSLYDPVKDELKPFQVVPTEKNWRFSNMLHIAYSDRQGNLWLSTRGYGLEKIIFNRNNFHIQIFDQNNHSISNEVRAVFEDTDCNLWVSTKDNKVRIYNKDKKFLGFLNIDGSVKPISMSGHNQGVVYCFMQDDKQNIWMGTKGGGVFKLKKRKAADHLSFDVTHYQNNPTDIYSLSNNNVYSVFQDSRKNIWVGSLGGGLNLYKEDKQGKEYFVNSNNSLKNYPIGEGARIRYIEEDKYGRICIGTTLGLIMFDSQFQIPENINYKHYSRIKGRKDQLNHNDIQNICNTSDGNMYIATFGGGVNKVKTRDKDGYPLTFTSLTKQDGLPSDVIVYIAEDKEHNLWICSENDLTKYNPVKNVFETFGEVKRLMASGNFSEASYTMNHSGNMIWGFSNGILSFNPQKMQNNKDKPYLALEKLRLFNKVVEIGGKDSPLTRHLDDMDKLELTHKQGFISIEFAALDFIDPSNITYAYKLSGFDEDWNYVRDQRIANYTNLPKGKYVFHVKSTNSDGVWTDNERLLPIEVLPSFWETPFAYLLYFSIASILIFIVVWILVIFYRLKDKVKLEEKLSELKLSFFTDISHEIRTPLTMISGPIEFLQQDDKTPDHVKKQLKLISSNTNRMLRLINQILDFRKMNHYKLKVEETEIVPFIKDIARGFEDIAFNRKIDFTVKDFAGCAKLWIDKDAVEKIVFNLLSNAFKYTEEGKKIELSVRKKETGHISVEIKDEGIGMSAEKQKKLFTRFASFNEDKNKPSTGIGLSLAKGLADKHHATILVESVPNEGSCFKIVFLPGFKHFENEAEIIVDAIKIEGVSDDELLAPVQDESSHSDKPLVLIVEDDNDLRSFLYTILTGDYDVLEAVDGEQGLALAQKNIPDFIVSDIMMSGMDGIQLLKHLKTDINTSHIPVVLLTAKSMIEDKLKGLSYGADDYITKPFSITYFKARIENLLKQRKHLQEWYQTNLLGTESKTEQNKIEPISKDEMFIQNIVQQIENNLDNQEFTIDNLAVLTGMSRTALFKKIKSLTGLAPIDFIRDIKFKLAAKLLSTGQFTVKEVSYMIGMMDTKHFSKAFKAKYGVNPSEYRSSNAN